MTNTLFLYMTLYDFIRPILYADAFYKRLSHKVTVQRGQNAPSEPGLQMV